MQLQLCDFSEVWKIYTEDRLFNKWLLEKPDYPHLEDWNLIPSSPCEKINSK